MLSAEIKTQVDFCLSYENLTNKNYGLSRAAISCFSVSHFFIFLSFPKNLKQIKVVYVNIFKSCIC